MLEYNREPQCELLGADTQEPAFGGGEPRRVAADRRGGAGARHGFWRPQEPLAFLRVAVSFGAGVGLP